MLPSERRISQDLPVLPFDWPWESGEVIWPCARCASWRVEMFQQRPDGAMWVREWHAVTCPIWSEVALDQSG